jgi:ribokinase
MTQPTAAVLGQLARDLVLTVGHLPGTGTSAPATSRREQLGGKGANQAVALSQLGVRPSLIAVAGDDVIGDVLLDQARHDGIDVRAVVRRPGTLTGLIVELLEDGGRWRYVEHLPAPVLLTEADVLRARAAITEADAVVIQLQQPIEATLAAARMARETNRLVVLDGALTDRRLLQYADVVRADEREAAGLDESALDDRPSLLAIAQRDGNLFVWRDGRLKVPIGDEGVLDTTGGGDALTAGLTAGLLRGLPYEEAARLATAAAGATVTHVGGRPDLRDL